MRSRLSSERSQIPKTVLYGFYLSLSAGAAIQVFHSGAPEIVPLDPVVHWLRDSLVAVPIGIIVAAATIEPARRIGATWRLSTRWLRLVWAAMTGLAYSIAIIPGNLLHDTLFSAVSDHHSATWSHALYDAVAVVDPAIVALVAVVALFGAPWEIAERRLRMGRVAHSERVRSL